MLTFDRCSIDVPFCQSRFSRGLLPAIALLRGSSALTERAQSIMLHFPASHEQTFGAHFQQVACEQEMFYAPTTEFLALLKKLRSLKIHSLNAVSPHAQLKFPDMIQILKTAAISLTELNLVSCNITSRQFQEILDGIPSLRTLKFGGNGRGSYCPDRWSRALAHIATRTELSIIKLEVSTLLEHHERQKDDPAIGYYSKYGCQRLCLLGQEYDFESAEDNATRYITKIWRSPDGFQQYKLGNTTSFMFGKRAIRAGLKIMLGNIMSKEEVESLHIET